MRTFAAGEADAQSAPEQHVVGTAGGQSIYGYSWVKNGEDRTVVNEAGQEIAKGVDILLGPDLRLSHVVVKAGSNIVALPVSKLGYAGNSFVLRGYTAEDLKAAPKFEYMSK